MLSSGLAGVKFTTSQSVAEQGHQSAGHSTSKGRTASEEPLRILQEMQTDKGSREQGHHRDADLSTQNLQQGTVQCPE